MTSKFDDIYNRATQLSNQGKYEEAGDYVLQSLGVVPEQVHRLDVSGKKLAFLAASCFSKSSRDSVAIEILLALGERSRAADLLDKKGELVMAQKVRAGRSGGRISLSSSTSRSVDGSAVSSYTAQRLEKNGRLEAAVRAWVQLRQYGEAARLYMQMGNVTQAANMYAEGGMALEAARCYLTLKEDEKALDSFVRVPRDLPVYRESAMSAISVAARLDTISLEVDHFLGEFIRTAPQSSQECEALYQLSQVYQSHGLVENAKEVLNKLAAKDPRYRDTRQQLEKLERFSTPSAAAYDKIRDQEASFRDERRRIDPQAVLAQSSCMSFPDLPPAPDLSQLKSGQQEASISPSTDGTDAGRTLAAPPSAPVSDQMPPQVPVEEAFAPGNMVAGRYRIVAQIGRGGMAAVYRVDDRELDETVALKLFLTQVTDSAAQAQSEQRFRQELKLSRKLMHRNIIRLYDIGFHGGYRYISMELLEGRDLENYIDKNRGVLDFKTGVFLMVQACAGLNAAHEMGIVHRDVKPENLFVTRDGVLKLMDFGIARDVVNPGMTLAGMVAGTPHYMAPEQISGFSNVTHSADLYAIGVILYRMFTGQLPFDHDDLTRLLMMHINQEPPFPKDINPLIPTSLQDVILKLMSKDPVDRYRDARETAAALKTLYHQLN